MTAFNSNQSFFISGPVSNVRSVAFFISAPRVDNNNSDLFISGPENQRGVELFTEGMSPSSGNLDFYVNSSGLAPAKGSTSAFTKGPIAHNQNIDSFTTGSDNINSNIPLFTKGPVVDNNTLNTFTKGPVVKNETLPTYLNSEAIPSGDFDLFIYSDKYSQPYGGGHSVSVSNTDVFISGRNLIHNNAISLYASPQESKLPASGNAPIYLKVDEPVQGQIGFVESGSLNIFMNPNNDAGVFFSTNSNTSLYLKNQGVSPYASGSIPLYIEKVTDSQIPLYTNSTVVSNEIILYSDGVFVYNSGINMFIRPLQENNTTLYTTGYME